MSRILFLAFLLLSLKSHAQQVAFTKEQIVALISEWKDERMPDGRPLISDRILERLKKISLEEAKDFANVPEAPGLGIELNDEVVKKHPDPKNPNYFAPTPDWDKDRSWDRLYN